MGVGWAEGSPRGDGPPAQARLHDAPALLDAHELLVAERQVLDGQRVVVGGDDPLAVELGLTRHRRAVDLQPPPPRLPQVLAEAPAGEQLAGALRVPLLALGGRQGGELRRQQLEQALPMTLLIRSLLIHPSTSSLLIHTSTSMTTHPTRGWSAQTTLGALAV
jgi:hypothetical protein